MRQRYTLNTPTQLSLSIRIRTGLAVVSVVLVSGLAVAALIFIHPRTATYSYAPDADQNWSNPSNWSPTYPGTFIPAGESVVLYGPTQVQADELRIEGELTVEREGYLSGPKVRIRLLPGGALRNRGEIQVRDAEIGGTFENAFGATFHTGSLTTSEQSLTLIQPSGSIWVEKTLENRGNLRNFGLLSALSLSDPFARLEIVGRGKLILAGKAVK